MRLPLLFLILGLAASQAQQHDLGLTLGSVLSEIRTSGPISAHLSNGLALQANYGYRLTESKTASLYLETHFLANPSRQIDSTTRSLTRDVATLYVMPGLRLKFLPGSRVSPWAAAGAGYALYEQSTTLLNLAPNPAVRLLHRAGVNYGGGVDIRAWRMLSLRAEVRDVYTGSPAFNTRAIGGGQHNVVAGGGIVLRFR